jgi:hypothetical protein
MLARSLDCFVVPLTLSQIAPLFRCPVFGRRVQVADHRRVIERLADLPRLFLIPHRLLQVTARHVESERVAEHVRVRRRHRDIAAALADCGDELDFVVVVLRHRGIRVVDRHALRHELDRIGGLLEKERRLAIGIRSHLA